MIGFSYLFLWLLKRAYLTIFLSTPIFIRRSSKEKQLAKENRKIYKLTAAFLI